MLRYADAMRYWLLLLLFVIAAPAGVAQTRQDPEKSYTGVGPGHFVLSVTSNGQFVTLEDKSRWEIDPGAWFRTMYWQAETNISVRRAEPGAEYAYTLINLDQDEGAGAQYLPR